MLFLIKLIRKVFKQIKSDLTPCQIAVGVFLGVLMGLTPSGLHWILLFVLALFFNCSMGMFLLCWGSFKLFFLVIAGSAFDLGFNLLAGGSGFCTGLAQFLSEAPLLAWLGYERYLVFGAYVVAIPATPVRCLVAGWPALPTLQSSVSHPLSFFRFREQGRWFGVE